MNESSYYLTAALRPVWDEWLVPVWAVGDRHPPHKIPDSLSIDAKSWKDMRTPLSLKMALANPGWGSWAQGMAENMPGCCLFGCVIETTERSTAIAVSLAHLVCFSGQCYIAFYTWLQPKSYCLSQRLGPKLNWFHRCIPCVRCWLGIKLLPSVCSNLH